MKRERDLFHVPEALLEIDISTLAQEKKKQIGLFPLSALAPGPLCIR